MKHILVTFSTFLVILNIYAQSVQPELVDIIIDNQVFQSDVYSGYNNMQFSNADLDGDGIDDLVIFDRQSAAVSPYLWDTESKSWRFAREYRSIFPKDLRHWVLIRDFNNDGVPDIFTSKYIASSGIRVFKGIRADDELFFEQIKFYDSSQDRFFDELYYRNRSGDYRNLVVLTADIPAIADVDFDGDLDVLVFQESSNKVYFIKNVATDLGLPLDSLHFQLEDRCWGGFAEDFLSSEIYTSDAPGSCVNKLNEDPTEKEPLHAFSTLNVFDVDGDRDMDVFIGDADLDKVTFLNNERTDGIDWCNKQTLNFPENSTPIRMESFILPFFVNIDEDEEKEMLIGSNQYTNSDNVMPFLTYDRINGEFELTNNDWMSLARIDVGSESHPAIADVNQDGLLDLIVGNYLKFDASGNSTALHLFINRSTDENTQFELVDKDWLNLSDQSDLNIQCKPTFGDLDQDGDIDMLIGQVAGELLFFENVAGEGEPFDFMSPRLLFDAQGTNSKSSPQIIDLDRDGLNDVVVGNVFGTLGFIKNNGQPGNPSFGRNEPGNLEFLGNVEADPGNFIGHSTPYFIQTAEGLRCFVGNIKGEIKMFSGIEASSEPWIEEQSLFQGVFEGLDASLAMGDIDNDGRLEAVIGNRTGGLAFYETDILSSNNEVSNNLEVAEFKVYPNPADEMVNILVKNENLGGYFFELYDIHGKLVQQRQLKAGENKVNKNIWPAGVYFYRIRTDSGTLEHGKIVWK